LDIAVIARVFPLMKGTLTVTINANDHFPRRRLGRDLFCPENLKFKSAEKADQLRPLVPNGMTIGRNGFYDLLTMNKTGKYHYSRMRKEKKRSK